MTREEQFAILDALETKDIAAQIISDNEIGIVFPSGSEYVLVAQTP